MPETLEDMLQKKSEQPLKSLDWLFSQYLRMFLFGQENKNSNFHNFMHGDLNNPDKLFKSDTPFDKTKNKNLNLLLKRKYISTYTIMIITFFQYR